MREEILKIAKDLEQADITENEAQTLLLGLFDVMAMLPTEKEAEQYANGNFGFDEDVYDKEQAFISGTDWMRYEVERKLNGK